MTDALEQFFLHYDNGNKEGPMSLQEARELASDIYDNSKREWRDVDGIYLDGKKVLSQETLDDEFWEQEEKERRAKGERYLERHLGKDEEEDEDYRSDYDEHNTHFGLPSRLPSAYRKGW